MRLLGLLCYIFLINIISGCSVNNSQNIATNKTVNFSQLVLNKTNFNRSTINVVNEQELFHLSKNQRKEFLDYFQKKNADNIPSHRIVADFINDKLSNFTYYGKTFIAKEAMAKNKGNCMSLAIYTTAIAKLVNLEVTYREVNTLPVFEKHNNLLLSSTHVQTILIDPTFIPEKNMVYFYKPSIVIDYFPTSTNHVGTPLNYKQFVAMYYQNIAADALVANNLNKAFAYAEQGFEFDPYSSKLLNTLAVTYRRKGDLITAQKLYDEGLKSNSKKLSLVNNYIFLSKKQNNEKKVAELTKTLENLNDPNPYTWLEQAYIAKKNQQYSKAIRYFMRTLDTAPYVHQAYIGLYQVYLAKHQPRKAQKMLKKALEWTHEFEQRKMYKMKLFQLSASI